MWEHKSDGGAPWPDSSMETSDGNLTDITSDKSLLLGLSDREQILLSGTKGKPSRSQKGSNLSGGFLDGEKRAAQKGNESIGTWQSDSADEQLNSTEQSDPDSSTKGESDFSIEEVESNKITLNPNSINTDVDDLPSTVSLLKNEHGALVYVLGTAHFSEESQDDVSKVIQKVQPHIVMVELCPQRVNILQLDEKSILEEAKNINFDKIKGIIQQNGVFNGLIYILLLNMSARLTKELGIAPGGEFRRALYEAKKIPQCIIHLGDRPIQITMHRALTALSWWQTTKLVWKLLTNNEEISKEDVEKCKQRELLTEILSDMGVEFPALKTVFVQERDTFLTHSLQIAASQEQIDGPTRVVGVVGMGHVPGILENWGKVSEKCIVPIMKIPPPAPSSRILKFTLKVGITGLVIYTGYKIIPKRWFS